MKFLVPNNIYEDRLAICRSCTHYLSLLGNCGICKCFMKVKARIAPMECPKKFWQKTTEVQTPDDLPEEIIEEIIDVWQYLKTGRAEDQQAKTKMIDLYNTIFGTNYNTHTNCGSCLSTCFDGLKKLYKKYTL